ncbi:MAG: hypothetical protein O2783_02530 [Chloroflexi bacterium]|nr:hypothetical protein [Chloroflexota bacterium]
MMAGFIAPRLLAWGMISAILGFWLGFWLVVLAFVWETPVMMLWGAVMLALGAALGTALSVTYYLVRSRRSGQ